MTRPTKCRRVNFLPRVKYFKPAGIPIRNVEEVCLTVEEVESLRLKDLDGLEQAQSASMMNISRPTFHRVLNSARRKIAEALFSGKAIRIEGGNFEIPPCHFTCRNGHQWDVPFKIEKERLPQFCPTCQTPELKCAHPFEGRECTKAGPLRCCQMPPSQVEKQVPQTETGTVYVHQS
jgi:predicted DNA-binding protein (UPF0251 family)